MPKVDRDHLQAWYRTAMRRRMAELEALRGGLAQGDPCARAQARLVGHALRGSGGSFGFPGVTEVGTLLEDAAPGSLARILEGVVQHLRCIAWPEAPAGEGAHPWLAAALGIPPVGAATLEEAWVRAARALGTSQDDVARRLAGAFGLSGPEPLRATAAALRLVPEALLGDRWILPLDEDGRIIRIATANPVDLVTEADVRRVSGRSPHLVVVPPAPLREALGRAAPRRSDPPEALGAMAPAPARCTILVVDDDRGARILARAVLERRGYPVIEAKGGEEALERLAAHPGICLAVVDLEMPDMDGRELVRRLRARQDHARLAIVVLTGTRDPAVEADLIEAGADDYLVKPLDPRLFLARVSGTLRRTGAGPG
ncbi:MAG TPA: response regulator [Longimicrobiales bacterium]|nr:response regulator [Longimicrobiales bacterium]